MMIPRIRIWRGDNAMSPTAHEINQAAWLSGNSPLHSHLPQPSSIGIRPIVRSAAFIGAVIVPPELDACVALNGTLLWSGIYGLRHADRLEINGHSIWVAAIRS